MHLSVAVFAQSYHIMLVEMSKDELKELILESLLGQGFSIDNDTKSLSLVFDDKDTIRSLHSVSRTHTLDKNRNFIEKNFKDCSSFFASGKDIDINKFEPIVIPVEKQSDYAKLYRFSSLLWSIPVSNGFGRRQRFLVVDKNNNKLVGIFALGDPVYNMRIRDKYIGWNNADRKSRLYNLMDLFVAGAFPPYSNLLCGKLISMIAVSNEIRNFIYNKYIHGNTIILQKEKDPTLIAITTSSAFGRSSQYNRISFQSMKIYKPIGYSQGWGHFHLTNGLYARIKSYLKEIESPELSKNNFGDGPNWKFRILRTAFRELNLPQNLLFHGVQRQLFIAPLANNYKDYFCSPDVEPQLIDYPQKTLINFFIARWFLPRAQRLSNYKSVEANRTLAALRCRLI